MTKVCVIGGSGFLGSHVSDELTKAGFEVIIFDSSPSPWQISEKQNMIIGDILDFNSVLEATRDCFAIYNFAAISDLEVAIENPVDTAKINILGNIHALEACLKNNISRYIFASSVYVNSREGGFYKCSKKSAEDYICEYKKKYGLDYTIIRYGSLYGPRSNIHNGLWRIVTNAITNKTIQYQGNPDAMREYIHVQDAARASVDMLKQDFANEKITLTGQEANKVDDLLKMLAEILGLPQQATYLRNIREGHYVRTPYAYEPSISKKYIPDLHIDLGQGLLDLIQSLSAK
jgi:UDP-glucose 4-epimerase